MHAPGVCVFVRGEERTQNLVRVLGFLSLLPSAKVRCDARGSAHPLRDQSQFKYLGAPRASPPGFWFSVVLSCNGERAGFIIELARHATRDTSASDTPDCDSAALTLVTDRAMPPVY